MITRNPERKRERKNRQEKDEREREREREFCILLQLTKLARQVKL
jgi:hypothetical protein